MKERKITFFINSGDEDSKAMMKVMQSAGLSFMTIPTSGCLSLLVDQRSYVGIREIRYGVRKLTNVNKTKKQRSTPCHATS